MKNYTIEIKGKKFIDDAQAAARRGGWTLYQVSEIIGRSKSYLSNTGTRDVIGEDEYLRICNLLRLNPDDYIKPTNAPANDPKETKNEETTQPSNDLNNELEIKWLNEIYKMLKDLLDEVKATRPVINEINSNATKAKDNLYQIKLDIKNMR